MLHRRQLLKLSLELSLGAAALATAAGTRAQGRTVRLVVPYPPGGPLDIAARALAERLKDSLGNVVVENRPGAGGNLGSDLVAKAAPDGQTLVMGAVATHALWNPYKNYQTTLADNFVFRYHSAYGTRSNSLNVNDRLLAR